MDRLNYGHLRYFHAVVVEGSVTAAAEALHVSQPSVSAQIRKLERAIGYELFDRSGRGLALTPEGRLVNEYAEEIFRLGSELQQTVRGRLPGRPLRLNVGLAATVPNMVAFHFLEPAFGLDEPVRLVVRQQRSDLLLAELATHRVDLVLSDAPVPAGVAVSAFEHPLGSSPVEIYGPPLLAHRLAPGFPDTIHGEPFVLPAEGYALRRSLEHWFDRLDVQPRIVAEVEGSDLLNVMSEAGAGMFAAPSVIDGDIRVRYAVASVGVAQGIEESFYAITAERKIENPAVARILDAARSELAEVWAGLPGRAATPEAGA
jgi:LysR family transcriptional activator of nhaA